MVENSWWIAEWGNPCRECGFDWSQAPEVVIADIELPSMNGNSLATALRRRYGDDLRLVALAADDDSGSLEKIEHAGFDTILIKPASLEDILEAIQ